MKADDFQLETLTSTHLLFAVALSGIVAPNIYLNLREAYFSISEERERLSSMHFQFVPGVESIEVSARC